MPDWNVRYSLDVALGNVCRPVGEPYADRRARPLYVASALPLCLAQPVVLLQTAHP